ncbi:MAG: CvpA family protein [Bacteroidales bacterium]|jgi:membrane protein required for colicin V production|nr:CvpA family protein [Bacteroidales bacterium]MBR5671323.1 CvpA family protein [Bacteroidales bacterium]
MGIIDIIIICCFLPCLYVGARNGFIKQVISLIIIIVGIKLSISFSAPVSEWLSSRIELQPVWVSVISFAAVFIVVALVFGLVEKLLDAVIKFTMLGWLNRLLGIVFSVLKVVVLLSLLAYFINSANELLDFISEDKIAESNFFKPLLDLADKIFPALKSLIQQQPVSESPTIVA